MNSIEELEELKKEIDKREKQKQSIDKDIEKLKRSMESKLRKIAEKMGYDLVPAKSKAAVSVSAKPAKLMTRKRKPAAVKYRDGINSWTGRGLQPRWVKAVIAAGKDIENFRV